MNDLYERAKKLKFDADMAQNAKRFADQDAAAKAQEDLLRQFQPALDDIKAVLIGVGGSMSADGYQTNVESTVIDGNSVRVQLKAHKRTPTSSPLPLRYLLSVRLNRAKNADVTSYVYQQEDSKGPENLEGSIAEFNKEMHMVQFDDIVLKFLARLR